MSVATQGAETRTNRWAGPCTVCSTHVRRNDGTIVREGDAWRLYCAAHRGGSTPPANDAPSSSAPAGGDAPQISEAAVRAALALLRHAASDKRRPEGALDCLTEIATLCVWHSGDPAMARELYAALPSKMTPEPADERAADIIGTILDRKGERVLDDLAGAKLEAYGTIDNGVATIHRVDDATANATADALVGPPVDSPTSRAFADGTPGPARLAARFPIHPAPAPKRERASKGAGRWAHRKGNSAKG